MKIKVHLCYLCLLIISLVFGVPKTSVAQATTPSSVSVPVTVSVSVGEPKLSLFGYTSPDAQVQLAGIGVAKDTIANNQGYFFFDQVFLPFPTMRFVSSFKMELAYPDLYLLAVDTNGRNSFPASLPLLPTGPYDITVGPILLPPTITLEKGQFLPSEQVTASGQTIPDSQVTIALANEKGLTKEGLLEKLRQLFYLSPLAYLYPRQINAYYLPQYQIKADGKGHFQFNLPANYANTWRIFASTHYLDSPSPKSNTLIFRVLTWWQSLWEKIKEIAMMVFVFIRPYLWLLIIVGELAIIGFALIKSRIHADSRVSGS